MLTTSTISTTSETKRWTSFEFPFSLHRLAEFGKHVGIRVLDLFFLRVGKDKREVRLTPMLVFIQKAFWKVSEHDRVSQTFQGGISDRFLVSVQSRS